VDISMLARLANNMFHDQRPDPAVQDAAEAEDHAMKGGKLWVDGKLTD